MKSINGLRNLSKRGSRNFIDCDYEQKLSASEKEWLVNFNRANYCGDEKAMKEVGFSEELKKQIRHELNKRKEEASSTFNIEDISNDFAQQMASDVFYEKKSEQERAYERLLEHFNNDVEKLNHELDKIATRTKNQRSR